MNKLNYFVFFVLISLSNTAVLADSPWNSSDPWHDLTQSARNKLIVNTALQDLGTIVGKSCKEWVRAIVYEASDQHFSIPPTSSSLYMWQDDPTGQAVGMSIPIKNVVPGQIIQMLLKNGWEHTAIVYKKTSTTVTLIESNFDSTPSVNSDAKVTTRTLTFSQFYSTLKNSGTYSVYFIQ